MPFIHAIHHVPVHTHFVYMYMFTYTPLIVYTYSTILLHVHIYQLFSTSSLHFLSSSLSQPLIPFPLTFSLPLRSLLVPFMILPYPDSISVPSPSVSLPPFLCLLQREPAVQYPVDQVSDPEFTDRQESICFQATRSQFEREQEPLCLRYGGD